MKQIFLFLLVSVIVFESKAQINEQSLAYLKYKIKFVNDTTQKDKPYINDIYTVLGSNYSYYTSDLPEPPSESAPGGSIVFTTTINASEKFIPLTDNYLYRFDSKELSTFGNFAGEYTTVVEAPTNYKLEPETKTIGGYHSQKATLDWKGRQYEIWYTEELPFSTGPWKFVGLPGAILEVKDKSGDISITYEGFDKFDAPRPLMISRTTPQKVKYKEFQKLKSNFSENAGIQFGNMIGGPNSRIIIKNDKGEDMSMEELNAVMKKSNEELKKQYNNPVEF